jgi:hypothetical protein
MDPFSATSRWPGSGILAAVIVMIFLTSTGATELVAQGEKFVVTRDFQSSVIGDANPRAARVFINPVRLVTPSENLELHAFATRLLAPRVSVVPDKQDANYGVELILKVMNNPAIRNASGKWSTGFVLASICHLPIRKTPDDCGMMTYYFFDPAAPSGAFHEALVLWVDSILPSSANTAAAAGVVTHKPEANAADQCRDRFKRFVQALDRLLASNPHDFVRVQALLTEHFPVEGCDVQGAIGIAQQSPFFSMADEQPTYFNIIFDSVPKSDLPRGIRVQISLLKASGNSWLPAAYPNQ